MSQALSEAAIEQILSTQYIGHLACSEDNRPYVVPITYHYDAEDNSLIGYTAEGQKVNILRKNPRVSVAVSHINDLSHWQSVVVEGQFEEVEGSDAMRAIQLLITKLETLINAEGKQQVNHIRDMARASEIGNKVVYRIHIDQKSGRFEAGDMKRDI
jgi:hypothetical protein